MATTTPNYGWPVPTSTDFVKDGATAIEALGDAIDATVFGLPASSLSLISTTTIGTAVSSVAVTGVFSSTYDNYLVTVMDGVASGSIYCNFQLGATVAGYRAAGSFNAYNAGSVSAHTNNNTANWTNIVGGTTASLHGAISLFGPNLAKNTHMAFTSSQSVNIGSSFTGGGYVDSATQYTGFTIITQSGTLTGGTIRVYGYQN